MNTLTAPELLMILNGGAIDGQRGMRLALMELAGRGHLSTRREQRRRGEAVLVRRLQPDSSSDRAYFQGILDLILQGEELELRDFFNRLRGRFQHGFARFVTDGIEPEVARRGLTMRRREHVLWFFPVERTRLTIAGEECRAALQRQLAEGARLARTLDVPREEAVVLARALGPALLLVPDMRGRFD